MAAPSLSVVIPVFNEARHLPATIAALRDALERADFAPELIVVDDGSTDGSGAVAREAVDGRFPMRVLTQPNRGRFEARRAGLEAASGELVLLLDARVTLLPGSLRFVQDRLDVGRQVWNGHVRIETENAFGVFWRLLAELAWRDYFDDPRTTSFGADEFDRFPKGTTCFLAPRALLTTAVEGFSTHYADIRLANDDTPLLRDIAGKERINISPGFACLYAPRTTLRHFLRHSFHRGVVFVDGHGTPASRFFPAVLAFFPASALFLAAVARRPAVLPGSAIALSAAAAAYGAKSGRSRREIRTLAAVTPLYASGHGLGMWKGLGELVRARFFG